MLIGLTAGEARMVMLKIALGLALDRQLGEFQKRG
jgi:hypothetical protein